MKGLTKYGLTRREVDALGAVDDACWESGDGWAYVDEIAARLGVSEGWARQRMDTFVTRGLVERSEGDRGLPVFGPTDAVQPILDEVAEMDTA